MIRSARTALLLGACLAFGTALPSSAAPRLDGAGATFPAKIYQRWFADLAKAGGPQVNYQAVGSGSGRKAFIDQTVNFGASDDPMKKKDMAKVTRGVVQIPMVGGTIAFGYNKPGCDLKLTQEQAVRVAMGMIKDWKELGCKPGTLTWVHRSDGSGTTKGFTNSMQAFSKTWTSPGLGESLHGVGEALGSARTIRAVHPGKGAGLAAKLLPVLDHAHSDPNSLLLGELQVATWLVVAEGDGATHHRDLNHTTGDLGHVLLLHRIIRCTEVHGLVDEGFTA